MKHLWLPTLAALAWVAVATCLSTGAASEPQPRPKNIVFIMTDQQFAEVMSCRMGRQFIHTPVMDDLAAHGVLFTRAYTANPLCMPARHSLFTGFYPHQTRVQTNDCPPGGVDPSVFVPMGVYFRNAGYETAYSGKWHLCFRQKDTAAHGFEILRSRSEDNYDARVAAAAVRFLQRQHDRPFLLVVSFLNPHNICEWARRLAGREQHLSCGEIGTPPPLDQLPPAPSNLAPPENEPDGMTLMRRAYQVPTGLFPVADFTVEDWRKHRWGYYRMVEKVDGEIGKVVRALRDAGLEKDTLIVLTSDHGDCAGAHRFNQKTVFYEESARVPLVFSWRGHTQPATTDRLVNTGVDLLPTLLDAAGLPVPKRLPGRSLWPVVQGKPVSEWRSYVVVQNHMVQSGVVDGFRPTLQGRMVRTDRFKYCVYEFGRLREALYDLKNDPGETRNLAVDPSYRDELLRHRALLAEFARRYGDSLALQLLADDVAPRPFPKTSAKPREKRKGKKKRR